MRAAVERALGVRASLGLTGVAAPGDVVAAVAAAGLAYRDDRPYKGRIQGRFYRRTVCVRADLWPGQKMVVGAHELAHAVLGHAEGAFYAAGPPDVDDDEADAQAFAWTLIVGEPARTTDALTAQIQAAWRAGVPVDFLCAAGTILARGLLKARAARPATRSGRRSRAAAGSDPAPGPGGAAWP
jgi:hypothetical protein